MFQFTTLTFLSFLFSTHCWSINNFIITGGHLALPYSETIKEGITIGLKECKNQFKYDLWDCPTGLFNNLINPSKRHRIKATKESAFMESILSAGVFYSVLKDCHRGKLINLTVNQSNQNIKCFELGVQLTGKFFNEDEGGDALASINKKNIKVGRDIVKKTMKKVCRCHGLSGSCDVRSCWDKLNSFSVIGKRLKSAYKMAEKMELKNSNDNNHQRDDFKLYYTEDSPNFCVKNKSLGTNGVIGRKCLGETSLCQELCAQCGLTTKKLLESGRNSCNCNFAWCCQVKCEQCPPQTVFTCDI